MKRWEKRYGSYYLMNDNKTNNILYMTDSVAIAFALLEDNATILYKIGNPETVNQWVEDAKNKYTKSGYDEFADDFVNELIVIESDKFEVDDLNHILQTNDLSRLLRKLFDSDIVTKDMITNSFNNAKIEN